MPLGRAAATVLLAVSLLVQGCSADDPEAAAPTSDAVRSSPSSSPSTSAGPAAPTLASAEELEARVIPALAAVGVEDPGVAEHGFQDANLWGGWRGGTAVVRAYQHPTGGTPGPTVGTVDVGTTVGDVVATDVFGELVRVPCGTGLFLDVAALRGDGEPGTGDAQSAGELAGALLPALGC